MALVVFLRGVNVGGHRTFRPTQLAAHLKHLRAVNIGAAGTFVIPGRVTHAQVRAEVARRLPFDAEPSSGAVYSHELPIERSMAAENIGETEPIHSRDVQA